MKMSGQLHAPVPLHPVSTDLEFGWAANQN